MWKFMALKKQLFSDYPFQNIFHENLSNLRVELAKYNGKKLEKINVKELYQKLETRYFLQYPEFVGEISKPKLDEEKEQVSFRISFTGDWRFFETYDERSTVIGAFPPEAEISNNELIFTFSTSTRPLVDPRGFQIMRAPVAEPTAENIKNWPKHKLADIQDWMKRFRGKVMQCNEILRREMQIDIQNKLSERQRVKKQYEQLRQGLGGIDEQKDQENIPADVDNVELESLQKRGQKIKRTLIMKGGGVKGLAYIGALKELEKYYDFYWFAGTSAGAITAALLASGYKTDEMENILREKNFSDFKDAKWWMLPINLIFRAGLYQGNTFTIWIEQLMSKKCAELAGLIGHQLKFEDLSKLPHKPRLTIYACRRDRADSLLKFDSADTSQNIQECPVAVAIRSSMSIPVFFTPAKNHNMNVLDGGMRFNYPVSELLSGNPNTKFIGLYLGDEVYKGDPHAGTFRGLFSDIFNIWAEGADIEALRKYNNSTVVIDPSPISTIQFNLTDIEKDFLLQVGRAAALKFVKRQNISNGPTQEEINQATKEAEFLRQEVLKLRKKSKKRRFLKVAAVLVIIVALLSYKGILRNNNYVSSDKIIESVSSEPEKILLSNNSTISRAETEDEVSLAVVGYVGPNQKSFMQVSIKGKGLDNKILVNGRDITKQTTSQYPMEGYVMVELEGNEKELNLLNGKNEVVIVKPNGTMSKPYTFTQAIGSQ